MLFLGYRPYTSDTIAFRSGRPIDMGTVSLVPEENRLEGIAVTGSRGRIVYKLDRQRIRGLRVPVGGGRKRRPTFSALPPSVRVDADGEVSFRGSTGFSRLCGRQTRRTGRNPGSGNRFPPRPLRISRSLRLPRHAKQNGRRRGHHPHSHQASDGRGTERSRRHGRKHAGGVETETCLLAYRKGPHRWYVGRNRGRNPREKKSDFGQQKTTIVDDYTTTVRRRRNPS